MGRYSLGGGGVVAPGKSSTRSRRRPGLRRAALCFLAVCAAPLVLPYAGGADEPSRQGWWWQGNQGQASAPAPPDVPADGLYVQGGASADAPAAFAAVLFNLTSDQTAKKLTLHLAQSQAAPAAPAPTPAPPLTPPTAPAAPAPLPGPSVQACAIPSGDFGTEQGGPMADAPVVNCAQPIAGTVDLVGGTVTFDLSSLPASTGTSLALAIMPVSATDRIAFQHPGADALQTESTPAPTTSDAAPAPDSTYDSPPVADTTALPDIAAPAPEIASAPAYTPGAASTGAPAVAPAPTKPAPRFRQPAVLISNKSTTATRIGQLAALGMVVAALFSYSRGYGLLGGRFADDD